MTYHLVETHDGLYTAIGLRVPEGDGPFPIMLFASGNGGEGPWAMSATTATTEAGPRSSSWTRATPSPGCATAPKSNRPPMTARCFRTAPGPAAPC